MSDPFVLESGMHVSGAHRPQGRVLVVDDEALITKVLQLLLADEFQVVCVFDGHEALATIERAATLEEPFDAIVCDLTMPILSGMDLHERLCVSCPDAAKRMIFMTGGAVTARARAFVATIPNAVIEKPLDMDELRALLRHSMGTIDPHRETG